MRRYLNKQMEQNIDISDYPLETLIAEIAAGSRASVSSLYEKTKTAVYGFALSILKNESDAEDVLQDTYIKIWSSAGSYNSMGKPMAWILTITKNLSLSILREKSKTADISEESWLLFSTDGSFCETEDRIVLETAMRILSDEERQIIILHAVSGLKHIEIAKLLSLPLPTVLSKYSRARKKLQNTLKEGI